MNIRILKWSDKQLYLTPVRGKRVAIKVKTNESYSNLLQKAINKFRIFYKDLLDTEYEYFLEPLSKKCDIYCNKYNGCINYATPHKGLE